MKKHILNLTKDTAVYGIGQVLNRSIGFLLLPLFTAYLTPADYGIIALLGVISFLVLPVFGLGLGTSLGIVYYKHDEESWRNATIWTAFLLLCLSSLILLTIIFLFSEQVSWIIFQHAGYENFIILGIVGAIFNGIISLPLILKLQFEKKAKLYVLFSTIITVFTAILNVFFVVGLGWGVEGWIASTTIASVLAFFLYFAAILRTTEMTFNLGIGKDLLLLGYPIIPGFVFLFIMGHSGKYMLQWYRGLNEVGIYTIGYTFGIMMSVAVNAFTAAWYPFFNSFVNKQEEAKQLFGKVLLYYVIGFGGISCLFFIFAKPAIMLMTQRPFHDAYNLIGIVALGAYFIGAFSILLAGVYFARRLYLVTLVQLSSALVCIFLNFILIPPLGMVGAAISFLLAHLSMAAFQYGLNLSQKYLQVQYDWVRIFLFSSSFIVIAAITLIPRDFTFFQELALSVLLAVAMAGMVYLQLNFSEKKVLHNLLKKRILLIGG